MRNWKLSTLLVVASFASATVAAAEEKDVLDLTRGAVVLSATSQYNEKWSALSLLDGTHTTGWCSAKDTPYPNTFIIELAQPLGLNIFVLDNSSAEESSHPGISACEFELHASATSPEEGFRLVLSGEAAQGERKEFSLKEPVEARWLKLVILSNWGHPSYTELMELEAYGDTAGEVPEQESLQGVFDTNYNLVQFNQEGTHVEGCYDWDEGVLSGSTDGRVVQFEWREDGGRQVGSAVMVLSSDGNLLNGLWYEKGQLQGIWFGNRVTDDRKPKCQLRGQQWIGKALQESGRVILYGIYFDSDSAELKPESEETLGEVLAVLEEQTSLRVVVEGHTDSTNTDEYNLKLSERRAQAVVSWLAEHGINGGRLEAKGYGESQPVADNATPQGRALNRRVEMAVVQ